MKDRAILGQHPIPALNCSDTQSGPRRRSNADEGLTNRRYRLLWL
jgi:hypothetical protein